MKKSVIIAVLGAAGFAVSSYGQGVIQFDTYAGSYNSGNISQVTYFNGASAGSVVPDGSFYGELYYALGTVSDPVGATAASITAAISPSFTAIASSITPVINGYIQDGTQLQIANYTSGAITFEIEVYNSAGTFVGRSGAFTESSINLLGVPATTFGSNGSGPGQMLVATSVPEPTTLALAGLGGLASLVALRRKQS